MALRPAATTYQSLGFLDMLVSEQELPVEIRKIDRVEVDDVDLSEAIEGQVLQQLAPDAPGAD